MIIGFLKNDIVTKLLIILIVIVLLILGIFIYKMNIDEEKNNNDTTNNSNENFVEQVTPIEKDTNKTNEKETQENTSNSVNEESSINTQIIDPRLTEIVDKFNSCDVTQNIRASGLIQYAIAIKDGIKIHTGNNDISCNVNLTLNNDILTAEILDGDQYISLTKVNLAVILVDCIGQIKGYPEKAVLDVLWNEPTSHFTLKNEGVEIKRLENDQGMAVRVNLNSDFPFMK